MSAVAEMPEIGEESDVEAHRVPAGGTRLRRRAPAARRHRKAEAASRLESGGGPMSLTLADAASMFAEDTHTAPDGCRGTAVLSTGQTRRYLLTRRWDDRPLMAWVMLNPSTADARTD